ATQCALFSTSCQSILSTALYIQSYLSNRYPPAFPTRRSSDLASGYFYESDSTLQARGLQGADRGAAGHGRARVERLAVGRRPRRSEEHTSELQSRVDLACRLLREKKKNTHAKTQHMQ